MAEGTHEPAERPESHGRSRIAKRSRENLGEWLAITITETADPDYAPVPLWRLNPVAVRPPVGTYLVQLWQRRHFILADARAKAFQTSRGTILGRVWLVLQPFLDSLVYFVIFGMLLQTSRGVENYIGYLVVGVNFFGLVQRALNSGGQILQTSHNLLRAFAFPRAAIVISWSFRSLMDFLPTVVATLVFIVAMPPHAFPSLTWVLFPGVLVLGWVFSMGLAFVTASLTARISDLKFIWPLLGRFWFYGSGVFFSIERFSTHPNVTAVMEANPGYHFLKMSRDILVYATAPTASDWGYMAAWAVGTLVVGFLVFWSHEESYGRER